MIQQLQNVIKKQPYTAEVIFVNDGSTDGTEVVLEQIASEQNTDNLQINVIHFRRNRGKAARLMADFAEARGEVVITMDADLQDDPTEIPKMLEQLDSGKCDVVSGWKYPCKDPLEKECFLLFLIM